MEVFYSELSILPIYSFIQSYRSVLTCDYLVYTLGCNLILYLFCHSVVPALAIESLFNWLLCSLDIPLSLSVCLLKKIYIYFYYSVTLEDTPGSSCIFLASPRILGGYFLLLDNGIRNQDLNFLFRCDCCYCEWDVVTCRPTQLTKKDVCVCQLVYNMFIITLYL